MPPKATIPQAMLLISSLFACACTHFTNIGTHPPDHIDHQPPVEVRLTITPKAGSPSEDGLQRQGKILAWDQAGLLFVPEGCFADHCQEQIPLTHLRSVESQESFWDGEGGKILIGGLAALAGGTGIVLAIFWSNPLARPWVQSF